MITWDLCQGGKMVLHLQVRVIHHVNEMKVRHLRIISTNAENSLDKIQHLFTIKTQQRRCGGNVPQQNTGHTGQTWSTHHTQWGETENFPYKLRSKTRTPPFATFLQHSMSSPSQGDWARKKANWKGKGEIVAICRRLDVLDRKP